TRVSNNLRGGSYSTDAMTTDAAKAMTTAMDNLDDILMLLSRPPDHERVAMTLPTVFLRFSQAGAGWTTPDPVWIRVPYWDRKNLPRRADIYLDGAGDAVNALKDSLPVTSAHKSYR